MTCLDAFTRFINGPQLVAKVLQKMRPPSKPGRDFQNRPCWQTIANTWKNCAVPLRLGRAPRFRPFFACLFPIVFHLPATDSHNAINLILTKPTISDEPPLSLPIFLTSIDQLDLLVTDIRARLAEQCVGLIQPAIPGFSECLTTDKTIESMRYSFGKFICISQFQCNICACLTSASTRNAHATLLFHDIIG